MEGYQCVAEHSYVYNTTTFALAEIQKSHLYLCCIKLNAWHGNEEEKELSLKLCEELFIPKGQ